MVESERSAVIFSYERRDSTVGMALDDKKSSLEIRKRGRFSHTPVIPAIFWGKSSPDSMRLISITIGLRFTSVHPFSHYVHHHRYNYIPSPPFQCPGRSKELYAMTETQCFKNVLEESGLRPIKKTGSPSLPTVL